MIINKLLTKTNYRKGSNKVNKYIVIHYTASTGSAEANCRYFQSNYRGASAHYFVGHEGEIFMCVEDKNIAWHCGATKYKHPYCRNTNSIGVEMCCKKNSDGSWYFTEQTVKATKELVKELMKKYNIPIDNVLRHYDVTGKICPQPYVKDENAWSAFKQSLTSSTIGYKVKVTADSLNVRQGPGVAYKVATVIKKNEAYTIIGEKNGWGLLKSKAGWINLKYTKRI